MFLKIQQSNKVSTLENAELVRDSVHRISDVCVSKLDVFFSRAISAAENKYCIPLKRHDFNKKDLRYIQKEIEQGAKK